MGNSVLSTDRGSGLLKIGEAATLTGVSAGRIRHYQTQGLVRPSRSLSGYRYFNADDLVRILQIDLLRSLGMGLTDIRASLPGKAHGESLRETLAIHRDTLRAERDRLDRLLAAVETALTSEDRVGRHPVGVRELHASGQPRNLRTTQPTAVTGGGPDLSRNSRRWLGAAGTVHLRADAAAGSGE